MRRCRNGWFPSSKDVASRRTVHEKHLQICRKNKERSQNAVKHKMRNEKKRNENQINETETKK
jgi:hypothetical protein